MLKAASPLLAILAVLTVMAACGSESPSAYTATIVPATHQPTLTEVPSISTPTGHAQTPALTPTMAASVPPTLSESPTDAPDPTVIPTKSPTQPEPTYILPGQEATEIRQIAEAYWEALNEYDVDHAITMLEPGYRAQEEELIRKDIGTMKLFRVKLQMTEETPPSLNADGDYETFLSMKTPVDTRRVLMVFRRIDGQWWIVFSDEVE